jgi:hypothetical protein
MAHPKEKDAPMIGKEAEEEDEAQYGHGPLSMEELDEKYLYFVLMANRAD